MKVGDLQVEQYATLRQTSSGPWARLWMKQVRSTSGTTVSHIFQGKLHIVSFHYAPLWAFNCIRLQQSSREAGAYGDMAV